MTKLSNLGGSFVILTTGEVTGIFCPVGLVTDISEKDGELVSVSIRF
jgi:hypothetical protein